MHFNQKTTKWWLFNSFNFILFFKPTMKIISSKKEKRMKLCYSGSAIGINKYYRRHQSLCYERFNQLDFRSCRHQYKSAEVMMMKKKVVCNIHPVLFSMIMVTTVLTIWERRPETRTIRAIIETILSFTIHFRQLVFYNNKQIYICQ